MRQDSQQRSYAQVRIEIKRDMIYGISSESVQTATFEAA